MVSSINGAAKKLATLGVCSGNHEVFAAHQIPLVASSYQSVDVISYWNENLTSQVPAFLATMKLVFEMDGSCSVLGEEFSQLHHSGKTAMPRIAIGYNRPQVIYIWSIASLFGA